MQFTKWLTCLMLYNLVQQFVTSLKFVHRIENGLETIGLGYERCGGIWTQPNFTALEEDLRDNVYGQHLVNEIVPKLVKGHYNDPDPSKALVISFHGWTGVGKNYVSTKLATHLYKRGVKSKFVKSFIATVDFADASKTEDYKRFIHNSIQSTIKRCERSMFIFDEVEKMPLGVLDAIHAYLDHNVHIHGVNYRRSFFIFLSNAGGTEITRQTLKHWTNGKVREDLRLKDIEPNLQKTIFNEDGGFSRCELIFKNLVSAYVPFLPLQREHVKLCIRKDALAKGITHRLAESLLNDIADELEYFPEGEKLFSTSGCKRVTEKVNLHLRIHREEL